MRLLENGATRLLENGASRLLEGEGAVVVTTEGNSYTVPRGAGRPVFRFRFVTRARYRIVVDVRGLEDRAGDDGWWHLFETVEVRPTTSRSHRVTVPLVVHEQARLRVRTRSSVHISASIDRAAMLADRYRPVTNLGARQESSG